MPLVVLTLHCNVIPSCIDEALWQFVIVVALHCAIICTIASHLDVELHHLLLLALQCLPLAILTMHCSIAAGCIDDALQPIARVADCCIETCCIAWALELICCVAM